MDVSCQPGLIYNDENENGGEDCVWQAQKCENSVQAYGFEIFWLLRVYLVSGVDLTMEYDKKLHGSIRKVRCGCA